MTSAIDVVSSSFFWFSGGERSSRFIRRLESNYENAQCYFCGVELRLLWCLGEGQEVS